MLKLRKARVKIDSNQLERQQRRSRPRYILTAVGALSFTKEKTTKGGKGRDRGKRPGQKKYRWGSRGAWGGYCCFFFRRDWEVVAGIKLERARYHELWYFSSGARSSTRGKPKR